MASKTLPNVGAVCRAQEPWAGQMGSCLVQSPQLACHHCIWGKQTDHMPQQMQRFPTRTHQVLNGVELVRLIQ